MPTKKAVKSVKKKGRIRDYIVRINIDNLRSVAVISLPATSRKEAVELVKGAIELTGEVAPINLTSLERTNMDEEIVVAEEAIETPAVEVEAVEAEAEVAVEEAVESAE